ncbi:AfsR/SARP family transcriptional regulator [Lentzea sp. CA-135723]|uniref:AfsR/SARP family transcriptional regulator n=1 Tax=Lentzea sp. CA-135723 TaxID=3239950 RepID=UPI003D8D3F1C
MRVLLLGPVDLRDGERSIGLGGTKPKTMLAALMLQPRQVVPIEQLIGHLWDEDPPRSATALVHTYVSTLRRAFASTGRDQVLVTRAPGYSLAVQAGESDLEAFEALVERARRLERAEQHEDAATHYQRALELWRGPALSGIDAPFARAKALALEEERAGAEEGIARCQLVQRHFSEVISRMSGLVARNPVREEAHGLLMRALYESERQADALAVYQNVRRYLDDELGVEPGEMLQQLHNNVLNGSLERVAAPAVVVPVEAVAEAPVVVAVDQYTVPRHLPPDIGDFTGRAGQLDLMLRISEKTAVASRTATATVVVSGFGGAGKSALAVHAAHMLRDRYPDGQLFADLREADPDLGVRDALRRLLNALGVANTDLPDDLTDRVELYRRKVAGRSLVVVLDNVSHEHQVRRLLPGSPHCLVIITSRSRLTGLEGAEFVELGFFDVEASVQMLSRIVGEQRIAAEPEAARSIARLCGGIPLAIRVAAAKLLARPHWPLKVLAGRLSDERRRLDELQAGDLAIRSSLQLNYTELGPLHRRAFHLLTLLDLPDFGAWLAAPLLEISADDAEDVVEHLVDLRLLDVVGVDPLGRVRYRFHDLIRLFGAEQAGGERADEAVLRMMTVWMHLVEIGARKLPRVTLGLRPPGLNTGEVDWRLSADVEENPTGWLKAETAAVVRSIERAHELGVMGSTTTLIVSLLASPFAVRNEFDGWQRILDVALTSARTSGDRGALATVHAGLGQLKYEQDDFAAALEHFGLAREHAEAVSDVHTQAVARAGLGTVHRELGETGPAAEHLVAAAGLAQEAGDADVAAAALYGLGAISRENGDVDDAVESLGRCVGLYREMGDPRGEALALRGLSLCHRARGEQTAAADLSTQAIAILTGAGDALGAAYARQSLAKALVRQGKVAEAAELLDACHEVFAQHRDRFGVALAIRTMGEAALAGGDDVRARELLEDALVRWEQLGLPQWQARTLRDLAAAASADDLWARAVDLAASVGGREAAELRELTAAGWRAHVRQHL